MSDDLDALLTRAERWDNEGLGEFITDLAAAVYELRADYLAALDVIARLSEGWDVCPQPPAQIIRGAAMWYLDPVLADEGEKTHEPMSDREWRVYCHAARRATHGNQT